MTYIQYIPHELSDIKDYKGMAEAVDPEITLIKAEITQMNNNIVYETASEEAIKKYEDELGIVPTTEETLDDRRYNLIVKSNTKIPYTEQWLRQYLKGLLGSDRLFSLTMDYDNYSFVLKMVVSQEEYLSKISSMLDTIVPTNLDYVISYLYNTYGYIKNAGFTYGGLKNKTYKYIKESEDL